MVKQRIFHWTTIFCARDEKISRQKNSAESHNAVREICRENTSSIGIIGQHFKKLQRSYSDPNKEKYNYLFCTLQNVSINYHLIRKLSCIALHSLKVNSPSVSPTVSAV